MKEVFFGFAHAESTIGKNLAEMLLTTIKKFGLDMENCRGLGFNGASNMLGQFRGCAALIQKDFPLAKVIHCFNHRLNLVISKACENTDIKVALGAISEVYNYIYGSTARRLRFSNLISQSLPSGSHRKKLVQLCPTRWIERHDSVLVFVEFLPILGVFLEEEAHGDSKAGLLLNTLREPRFLAGLVVAEAVLAHTLEPSRQLQSAEGNLVAAYKVISDIQEVLQAMRDAAATSFREIFEKA